MAAMADHTKCNVPAADVLIAGGRTGFLLVHRLGGTPADLEFMADGLGASGFTVSCPLLYGHGGSRELLGATTWTAWYGSVSQALEQLRDRCDTVIAGGIGVGALLALHLAAADQERVKGLVLYAPTLWPDGWAMPWYGNVLRALGHKGLANLIRFDERPPYGIKDDTLRQAMLERRALDGRSHQDVFGRIGGAFIELKRMADVVVPELPYIGQPSLIFHPREDDRSHMKASQLLAGAPGRHRRPRRARGQLPPRHARPAARRRARQVDRLRHRPAPDHRPPRPRRRARRRAGGVEGGRRSVLRRAQVAPAAQRAEARHGAAAQSGFGATNRYRDLAAFFSTGLRSRPPHTLHRSITAGARVHRKVSDRNFTPM